MTRDDKMLVTLRDELFGGSWERMREEFKAKLKGKPHVYRLTFRVASQMERHLRRIQHLQDLEAKHGIDLARLLRAGETT